ncbi:MAG: ABC transporter permease [Oscillospiraceae bacterium]|nr:ABC transporter permease [Oscillospiraceae bacterium]
MKKKTLSTVAATIVILVIWQILSLVLQKPFLPGVPASVAALLGDIAAGIVPKHFAISFYRVALALIFSFIFAVPLGLALGQRPGLDRVFAPMVWILYPLPKVVFLPVIVVLFGLGDFPKILLIAIVLFFQLLVVTRDASRHMREEYLLSARSLGMKQPQLWRHVLIPACLPQMLTALRVGVGTAIAILFFAETFAGLSGLGWYISDAMSRRSYDAMFAGIIAMAVLGLVFYGILKALEKRFSRWK